MWFSSIRVVIKGFALLEHIYKRKFIQLISILGVDCMREEQWGRAVILG